MLESTAVKNALLIVRKNISPLLKDDDVVGIYIDANWPNRPYSHDCFDVSEVESLKQTMSHLKSSSKSISAKYVRQIAEKEIPYISVFIVHKGNSTEVKDPYNTMTYDKVYTPSAGNICMVYMHTRINEYDLRYLGKGYRSCVSLARGIIICDRDGNLATIQELLKKQDSIKRVLRGRVEPQNNPANKRLSHIIKNSSF